MTFGICLFLREFHSVDMSFSFFWLPNIERGTVHSCLFFVKKLLLIDTRLIGY